MPQVHSLDQDQSTVAKQAEMTVNEHAMWACFLDGFSTLYLDNIVGPFWLSLVKSVCKFRWNLTPAILTEWPGPVTCHCISKHKGETRWIRVNTESSPAAPPRYRTCYLWSWVWHSTIWTMLTPNNQHNWLHNQSQPISLTIVLHSQSIMVKNFFSKYCKNAVTSMHVWLEYTHA